LNIVSEEKKKINQEEIKEINRRTVDAFWSDWARADDNFHIKRTRLYVVSVLHDMVSRFRTLVTTAIRETSYFVSKNSSHVCMSYLLEIYASDDSLCINRLELGTHRIILPASAIGALEYGGGTATAPGGSDVK